MYIWGLGCPCSQRFVKTALNLNHGKWLLIALLPIVQQYMYRRLAVDFNITDSSNANKSSKEICLERVGNSSELSGNEKDFQDSVSFWNTLVVALGLLPTIIVVIFIGAISDAWGRKFGLVPQLGAAVLSGIVMLLVVALDLNIVILPVIQFLSGMTGELIRVLPWDIHDDVIKWKHFPRNWPFVRGIHRSPVNSPQKGQWRGALMFSLICVRINNWVNNREAGDLRRHCGHYDVIVMIYQARCLICIEESIKCPLMKNSICSFNKLMTNSGW